MILLALRRTAYRSYAYRLRDKILCPLSSYSLRSWRRKLFFLLVVNCMPFDRSPRADESAVHTVHSHLCSEHRLAALVDSWFAIPAAASAPASRRRSQC